MVVMLLQLIFRKRRRGVSPVIAILLVVALAIAAATVVTTVLNSQLTFFGGDSEDVQLGSSGGSSSSSVAPTINVTSIQRDNDLQLVGVQDYVEVKVDVSNNADSNLYVFDVDLLVYGVKLDEVASWDITNADGATLSSNNGRFTGFVVPNLSSAVFTATLSDKDNEAARIPTNASFVYEVFYGNQAGVIDGSVQREKLSEVIFSPVFFDVAILHHGSSFTTGEAAYQYEQTLISLNGTNRIFFLYDPSTDRYDYQNNPGSIVAQDITIQYDIVIVDIWAVPAAISSQLLTIHQNQTKLVFYGSLSGLAADPANPSGAEVSSLIDVAATETIIGVTPQYFTGNSNNIAVTANSYAFDATSSSVLAGLAGKTFEEDEDESFTGGGGNNPGVCGVGATVTSGIGDEYGFDSATLSGSSANFISYGSSEYDFQDSGLTSIYTAPGALLVEKFENTAFEDNVTMVYSFIWKHSNVFAPAGADLVDSTHLTQIRINMLTGATGESTRVFTYEAKSTIDVFNVDVPSSSGKWFDLEVEGTIKTSPIVDGTMSITVDMPELLFHDCSPDSTGVFSVNSVTVATGISVVIMTDSVISIDIGDYYSGTIGVGDTYKLSLGLPNTQLFKIDADANPYNWTVTIDTGDFSAVTETFLRAVDSGADQTAPDQVTGLVVDNPTNETLDLSWNAATDNGGGTVSYYEISRNDVVIDTSVSTSYTDTGLDPDTTYTYKVRAVDDSANTGLYSAERTGTTIANTSPPQVTGLSATAVSSSQIDLSWTEMVNIDGGYKIYRDSVEVATVPTGTTFYNDTGLNESTLYSYEVSAVNNTMEGAKSNPATATTDGPGGATMYVSSISVSYTQSGGGGNPQYTIAVTFNVVDGSSNGLDGVNVQFTYSINGGASQAASGVTSGGGTVTVNLPNGDKLRSGDSFSVTVTGLTLTGYSFDSGSGVTILNDSSGPPSGNDATTS